MVEIFKYVDKIDSITAKQFYEKTPASIDYDTAETRRNEAMGK